MDKGSLGIQKGEGIYKLFVMLNGENHGVYATITNHDCLATFSLMAAEELGARDEALASPLRLFSIHGTPITSFREGKLLSAI